MLDSFFYSSMSNVLTQWSDFRVSKNLYKAYFDMKKSEKTSGQETQSARKKINYKNSVGDKLGKLSESVNTSYKNLESAFTPEKNGEINMDKAYSAAESFVSSYNDLVSSIKKSGDVQISGKHQFITNMTNAYSRRLENVGISIGSDGKLSIDKDQFKAASASDLDAVFGKKCSFAEFMDTQATQISKINAANNAAKNRTSYNSSGNKKSTLSTGELLDMLN